MLRTAAIAAALIVSGSAMAQDTSQNNDGSPERDARGIPVVSQAPNVPDGVNQTPNVPPGARVELANPSTVFATRPATSEYPPCTRGQTAHRSRAL